MFAVVNPTASPFVSLVGLGEKMAIRYRDRVSKLVDDLKNIKGSEAELLRKLIEEADKRHEADQLSLGRSFDRLRDLVVWAKSNIWQE